MLRDNIQGITKPAIRRLARRGGVKRISGLIYEEVGFWEQANFNNNNVLSLTRFFSCPSPLETAQWIFSCLYCHCCPGESCTSCLLGECDAGRSDVHGARQAEDRPCHRCRVCSQTARTYSLWLWLLSVPMQIFWSHVWSLNTPSQYCRFQWNVQKLHVNTSEFYNIFSFSQIVCGIHANKKCPVWK